MKLVLMHANPAHLLPAVESKKRFIELNWTLGGSAVTSGSWTARSPTTATRLCLIHTDRPTLDFSAVQPFDRGVSSLIGRHFDETEPTGPVSCTVHYHLRTFYFPRF
jgi:hypothetical protein